MSRRWMMGFLMVLCGTGIGASPALGAIGPGGKGGEVPGFMQKSLTEHAFGFTVGPVVAATGFQPCTGLSGYQPEPQKGDEMANTTYSINYCATGKVTVKQKSIANMTGKPVDLIVTNWHSSGNWSSPTHTYRLAFQSKDALTFDKVSFASGLVDNPAQFSGSKDPAWIAQHLKDQVGIFNAYFLESRPVKLEVKYNGTSYATLHCAFKSSFGGATTITCQGSPSDPVSGPPMPVPKNPVRGIPR